jgi:hypothetical protein
MLLPVLMILLGAGILVRTIAAGGGPLAFGVLMGILFIAAGAIRLVLERRA